MLEYEFIKKNETNNDTYIFKPKKKSYIQIINGLVYKYAIPLLYDIRPKILSFYKYQKNLLKNTSENVYIDSFDIKYIRRYKIVENSDDPFNNFHIIQDISNNEILFLILSIERHYKINVSKKFINNNKEYIRKIKQGKRYYTVTEQSDMYVTYTGFLNVLMEFKNQDTISALHKISNLNIKINFGNRCDKFKLVSDIMCLDERIIDSVFNDVVVSPCMYIFELCPVSHLRDKIKLSGSLIDNNILCMYGYANDMDIVNHKNYLKLNKNFDIHEKLITYSIIDPIHIVESEKFIDNELERFKIEFNITKRKVILISVDDYDMIKEIFNVNSNKFSGKFTHI